MPEIIEPLVLGLGFGWMLHKAGLTHYARIVNIYRLRDMTVMQFMLVALLVGAVVLQAGVDLGWSRALVVPATLVLANFVGGIVFGVGMATAGYCPGTIVAEAGEGRIDAWIAGFSGLFVGAIAFALLQPRIMPVLARIGALGHVTVAQLIGASPWLVLVVFGELVVIVLVLVAPLGKRAP